MLLLLSYLAAFAGFVAFASFLGSSAKHPSSIEVVAYCFNIPYYVALGLLRTCDFIEDSPSLARRVGTRLIMVSTCFASRIELAHSYFAFFTQSMSLLSVILTLTDELPYSFLLASIISSLASINVLKSPYWPANPANTSTLSLTLALLSPLIVTGTLLTHFHAAKTPLQDTRARWPGGRQDWDIQHRERRQYTIGQELTCLTLFWLPSLWLALGAIAENWDLPSNNPLRRSKQM